MGRRPCQVASPWTIPRGSTPRRERCCGRLVAGHGGRKLCGPKRSVPVRPIRTAPISETRRPGTPSGGRDTLPTLSVIRLPPPVSICYPLLDVSCPNEDARPNCQWVDVSYPRHDAPARSRCRFGFSFRFTSGAMTSSPFIDLDGATRRYRSGARNDRRVSGPRRKAELYYSDRTIRSIDGAEVVICLFKMLHGPPDETLRHFVIVPRPGIL